jgi:hypothetical protein
LALTVETFKSNKAGNHIAAADHVTATAPPATPMLSEVMLDSEAELNSTLPVLEVMLNY